MSSSLVLEAWLTMAWLTFKVFSDGWLTFAGAVALAGLVARLSWSDFVGEDGVVVLMELLVALLAGKQPKGVKMVVEDAVLMGLFAIVSFSTLVFSSFLCLSVSHGEFSPATVRSMGMKQV